MPAGSRTDEVPACVRASISVTDQAFAPPKSAQLRPEPQQAEPPLQHPIQHQLLLNVWRKPCHPAAIPAPPIPRPPQLLPRLPPLQPPHLPPPPLPPPPAAKALSRDSSLRFSPKSANGYNRNADMRSLPEAARIATEEEEVVGGSRTPQVWAPLAEGPCPKAAIPMA